MTTCASICSRTSGWILRKLSASGCVGLTLKNGISFPPLPRQHRPVTGAFLNSLGILLGALFGLAILNPLSARTQNFFKLALGALTVVCGLKLVVDNLTGTFGQALWQLCLAVLAVMLGSALGALLKLQAFSNRVGRRAADLLAAAQKNPPGRARDGWLAGTILFCAAPLGLIGAVTDGLSGFFYPLLLKAVMDGLAMAAFVKMFRWPAALAALPVFLFFYALSLAVHFGLQPWLAQHELVSSIQAAAGLIICATSLVILEVRRVELNRYLPALVVAPILKFFLG